MTTGGSVTVVGGGVTGGTPRAIAVGSDGKVWLSTGSDTTVLSLDTSGTTNNNVVVFTGSGIWNLTVDSNGAIWFPDASGLWKMVPWRPGGPPGSAPAIG